MVAYMGFAEEKTSSDEIISYNPKTDRVVESKDIPEWAVRATEVADMAKTKWSISRRTMQWYSSKKLLPPTVQYGREAYYDKRNIYLYLTTLRTLFDYFDAGSDEIIKIFKKLKNHPTVATPEGKKDAMKALHDFLKEYVEYRECELDVHGKKEGLEGQIYLPENIVTRLKETKSFVFQFLQEKPESLLGNEVTDIVEMAMNYKRIPVPPF